MFSFCSCFLSICFILCEFDIQMSVFSTILGFCVFDMACTCDVMELAMMIYNV